MGKPKDKTNAAKLEGDLRAHTNAIEDLQRQINLLKQRLDKVEVAVAEPFELSPQKLEME